LVCSWFYVVHTLLLSFPTRRSSDLGMSENALPILARDFERGDDLGQLACHVTVRSIVLRPRCLRCVDIKARTLTEIPTRIVSRRSEEHTSELQSRENLVCRLLLEKK